MVNIKQNHISRIQAKTTGKRPNTQLQSHHTAEVNTHTHTHTHTHTRMHTHTYAHTRAHT